MSASLLSQLATAIANNSIRVIDLTQTLRPSTPVIALPAPLVNSKPFTIEEISRYDERGPGWYWNNLSMGEHTGTHFDAPIHWVTGKDRSENACDTIPARRFVGPACVIDVTADVSRNPDFLLTRQGIEAWEQRHGRIPKGSWVLLRTGWSQRTDPIAFLNAAGDGPHSPGFAAEASRMLAEERDVLGVGVETIGTDAGQGFHLKPPYPCHYYMHGNGRYGLQCLTNLDLLPPTGAIIVCPPLKIRQGSGSPLRVLALLEEGPLSLSRPQPIGGARTRARDKRARKKRSVPSRSRRAASARPRRARQR